MVVAAQLAGPNHSYRARQSTLCSRQLSWHQSHTPNNNSAYSVYYIYLQECFVAIEDSKKDVPGHGITDVHIKLFDASLFLLRKAYIEKM